MLDHAKTFRLLATMFKSESESSALPVAADGLPRHVANDAMLSAVMLVSVTHQVVGYLVPQTRINID